MAWPRPLPFSGRPAVKAKKNGEVKVKAEWAKFYERLLELREQLMRQMNGLAKESAQEMAGYSLHMADSGTDNFDRDFALSLLSSDQDAIYEIEEALKRIEKNTYGVCELTGKPIPKSAAGGDPLDPVHRRRPRPNWSAKAPCASAASARSAPWTPSASPKSKPKRRKPEEKPKEKE